MKFSITNFGIMPRLTLSKAYDVFIKVAPYLVALLLIAGSVSMWLKASYQGGDKLVPVLVHLLISEALYVVLALLAIGGLISHAKAYRPMSRYPASRLLSSVLLLAGGALALIALFSAFSNALAYLLSFGDQVGTVDPDTMEIVAAGLTPDSLLANSGGFFFVFEYAQMALLGLSLMLAPEGTGALSMAIINVVVGLTTAFLLYVIFRFLSERVSVFADIAEGSERA